MGGNNHGLYISGHNAKAFFHLLQEQKSVIEVELGYQLEWEELPNGLDSRVAIYLDDVDPEAEKDWPRQHEWLRPVSTTCIGISRTGCRGRMPMLGICRK